MSRQRFDLEAGACNILGKLEKASLTDPHVPPPGGSWAHGGRDDTRLLQGHPRGLARGTPRRGRHQPGAEGGQSWRRAGGGHRGLASTTGPGGGEPRGGQSCACVLVARASWAEAGPPGEPWATGRSLRQTARSEWPASRPGPRQRLLSLCFCFAFQQRRLSDQRTSRLGFSPLPGRWASWVHSREQQAPGCRCGRCWGALSRPSVLPSPHPARLGPTADPGPRCPPP